MKAKNSSHAHHLVELLLLDSECSQNQIKKLPRSWLENRCEEFLNEIRTESLTQKLYCNAASLVPGDEPPAATSYPDREELQATPLPVPVPTKTETATATKISIPDYGDAKRFSVAMGELAKAGSKLFEIASENQEEKNDARRVAFGWHDELRSTIYDL